MLLKKQERTIESLTAQLCGYERALGGHIEETEEVLASTSKVQIKLKSNDENLRCRYCSEKGHRIKNCKKWIKDGRPKKPTQTPSKQQEINLPPVNEPMSCGIEGDSDLIGTEGDSDLIETDGVIFSENVFPTQIGSPIRESEPRVNERNERALEGEYTAYNDDAVSEDHVQDTSEAEEFIDAQEEIREPAQRYNLRDSG
uniref:CCHC-type domain-containing protein n=1 Tax=Heliothis virescens TaxID=7102 RepID=A0A2A4J6U4_HELVI